MSTTTKSPRKVLVVAHSTAQRTLSAYRHRFSPKKFTIEHILADAGYDSESNHRYAREECHIKSTIPPNHGRPTLTPKPFKGKYRELMRTKFDKKTYARTYWAQCREMMLLVLTHNIAVLLLVKKLFYRATGHL